MTTCPSAPYWLQFVQPFATLILGLGASAIAWRQWKTANDKLRLDMLEKRIDIFNLICRRMDDFDPKDAVRLDAVRLAMEARSATIIFGRKLNAELLKMELRAVELEEIQSRARRGRPHFGDDKKALEIGEQMKRSHQVFVTKVRRILPLDV